MKQIPYILVLIIIFTFSCKKKENKKQVIERTIVEWTGKEVIFPESIKPSYVIENGSASIRIGNAPYKILLYTDSSGCMSCKLKLTEWKRLIHESDSLMKGQVDFLFYFQPIKEKELRYLFKRDGFDYLVYVDAKNEIQKLNNFPAEVEFQCFLLDKDNKVLSIGNPTLNQRVWNLYKKTILGEQADEKEKQPLTTIEIGQSEIQITNLKAKENNFVQFVLKNTGGTPLLINHIDVSCGCTIPSWDKKPIKPNEESQIKIQVKPDEIGYFKKTILVHCNTEHSPISLTISGIAK